MTHKQFTKLYLIEMPWHIKNGVLYVDDYLDLRLTDISELPNNLSVSGSLDLDATDIKTLPDYLSVGHIMWLYACDITTLPENLYVSTGIFSDNKLSMTEKAQLNIISQNLSHFGVIKDPTEKAKTLQKLLWEL